MPHRQLLREMASGQFKSMYLLHGEEPHFIDELVAALESQVVDPSMKDFNQSVFYGKDSELGDILDAARRFPMMADRQLVLVKEAQELAAWRRKDELARLEAYAENPVSTTVLVFAFKGKKADSRLKAVKLLSRNGVLFLSEKVKEWKLAEWIHQHVNEQGLKIDASSSALLADHLGNDLKKIVNEVNKLKILMPAGAQVTPESIEEHIGISKDFNVFELQNAIAAKDVGRANRIVNYFEANPKDHPVAMILPVLGSFFNKLFVFHGLKDKHPASAAREMKCAPFAVKQYAAAARHYNMAKVGRIFGYLREADRKSKGQQNATTSNGMLLREAVFKILH